MHQYTDFEADLWPETGHCFLLSLTKQIIKGHSILNETNLPDVCDMFMFGGGVPMYAPWDPGKLVFRHSSRTSTIVRHNLAGFSQND